MFSKYHKVFMIFAEYQPFNKTKSPNKETLYPGLVTIEQHFQIKININYGNKLSVASH